jgi:hypothetical protein
MLKHNLRGSAQGVIAIDVKSLVHLFCNAVVKPATAKYIESFDIAGLRVVCAGAKV